MPTRPLFISNAPGSAVPGATAQEQRAWYRHLDNLPPEDESLGICSRHRMIDFKKEHFRRWPLTKELPPDINFDTVKETNARAAYCSLCRLMSSWTTSEVPVNTDVVDVMGCWVRDGQRRCHHAPSLNVHAVAALPKCDVEDCPQNSTTLRWRVILMTPHREDFEDVWCDFVPVGGDGDLFCGRPLLKTQIDILLMRSWIAKCDKWHQRSCGSPSTTKLHSGFNGTSIRLLDLVDNCLIETPNPPPYLCLSYVWGTTTVHKTSKDNIENIKIPGSLITISTLFPISIQDAIAVTRLLDERYIWVDSICIIQDCDTDKGKQISLMDQIYLNAKMAIVIAGGNNAASEIDGIKEGSRNLETSTAVCPDGHTLMKLLPELHQAASASVWNTRGWTYQERLLSRRSLFFINHTVYFQCQCAIWGEDYDAEHPDMLTCTPMQEITLSHDWEEPVAKTSTAHKLNIFQRPWYPEYARTVGEYTMRNMSFETDRLAGFGAVLNTLHKAVGANFVQGMPEDLLLEALLWQPRQRLVRVVAKDKDTGMALFPSWSWAGWVGGVEHEDLEDFGGVAPISERWRRTRPFTDLSFVRVTEPGTRLAETRGVGCYREDILPREGKPGNPQLPLGWNSLELPDHGIVYIHEGKPDIYHTSPSLAPYPTAIQKTIYNGIRLRTRLAKFNLIVADRSGESDPTGRPFLRFGISLSNPPPLPQYDTLPWSLAINIAGKTHPWLGGIRLPGTWRRRKFRAAEIAPEACEFIILSAAYGFGRDQVSERTSLGLKPYEVVNVMLVERVQEQSTGGAGGDSGAKPLLVERLGVGRMVMDAWSMVPEAWQDIIIV